MRNSFNTQPPEGGCDCGCNAEITIHRFQHTATRRWLPILIFCTGIFTGVSTHSHPKVAAYSQRYIFAYCGVSTHSHPKVAARPRRGKTGLWNRFNTQPPEGGCHRWLTKANIQSMFQHTATRRWLLRFFTFGKSCCWVSTHSHPKVAAVWLRFFVRAFGRFQHTATRRWLLSVCTATAKRFLVSTHSHPKVAAFRKPFSVFSVFTFQHTATRRWLLACVSLCASRT